ncbi:MAG: hypothetical protein ACHRXM_05910 [Isosphaerales bacterium]
MISTRGNWLRSLLAGLSIMAAQAGAPFASAQGFGPDPFQPYNSQFEAYTRPIGPAGPGAGQGGMNARSGGRRDNEFQTYLNELAGTARAGAEKYGIGMPYYRSTVDSRFDTDGKREYRPNRKADSTYEQTQELITQKYFAYFAERDPARRAALIRDYNQTRRRVSHALSSRRENPTSILDAATEPVTDRRMRRTTPGRADDLSGRADSTPRPSHSAPVRPRSSDAVGSRSGSIPPPPPLPPSAAARSSRTRRTPAEVLNRAQDSNP